MSLTLPLDNIQGIVLRGYGHLAAACFILARVRDARVAAKYLGGLPITDAATAGRKHAEPGPFINVAFTHAGLTQLGVAHAILDSFPRDFVEGPDTPERARILGDLEDSASDQWRWGRAEQAPHVVIMIYARTDADLAPTQSRYVEEALSHGMDVVSVLGTKLLTGRKEHFGFRDGIAQPVIAGARDAEPAFNTLPPGEVLLGYENAFGNVTHAPKSDAVDFGKSGSYMVLRTLAQDVPAFWRYCVDNSGPTGAAPDPITLASKMVGRWPSGAPITKYPEADPGVAMQDEDRFAYMGQDPNGERCPFGAHVRRSNPRDDAALAPDPKQAMTVANRHRLMRRGRAYGAPLVDPLDPTVIVSRLGELSAAPATERGLQFICFQGSIERQFEFVQQQWCNNPKFAGLNAEADPLIGLHLPAEQGGAEPVFTVPGKPVRRRAPGIQRFTHVRGAGYFFMPSLSAVRHLASLA